MNRFALFRMPLAVWGAVMSLLLGLLVPSVRAADVTWDGDVGGTGGVWLTGANWNPDTVPGPGDNAIFDAAGTATTITINMATAGGLQQVGAITLAAGNFTGRGIRNNSTGTAGVLQLNGTNGFLLANYSGATMILSNAFGTSQPMVVRLANSGIIHVDNAATAGQIVIQSSMSESGGARGFTKTGPGILYLRGTNNIFTGPVTNTAGAIRLDDSGTPGKGIVYMNGGNIICGLDRSAVTDPPVPNNFVMLTDGIIYGDSAASGTRTLPLTGTFSGSVGTLTIGNLGTFSGNTFQARFLGAFTFGRPIIVGPGFDTGGSFSVLQLYNSATNGMITLTGDISGQGSIRRQGATSSAGGTAILTGNNTYSGGTLVTYGTLLANNVSGSALGSGSVIVTNAGVLGGNGAIVASTSVSFNGTLSPGSTSSNVANLSISDLTLGENAVYTVQVSNATGAAGSGYDSVAVSGIWVDAATSINPVTIKLDSLGVTPANWNSGVARDWVIIDANSASSFDASHFTIDTTAFAGTIQGVFSLSVVSSDLHLTYTPASDLLINVPAGSVTQGQTSPTPYPILTGTFGVMKIGNGEVVLTNSLNDYVGSTKIYAGTASLAVDALNGSGAFGNATTAVLLGNTTGNSNATLNINAADVTMGRGVVVQSGSTGVKTIGTTIASGTATNSGDVTLNDAVTLTAPAGGTILFSGTFSGTNSITKTGTGTVAFGADNSVLFTGKTRILGGTLSIDAINRLGVLPVVPVDDQVTVSNATLEFTASTTASGGNRGIRVEGGATFNVLGGTLGLNGPVSGPGSLIKTGVNRLELNSATNSYAGDTFLLDGEIGLDDDGSFGAGTLRLGGGGIAIQASRSTTGNFIPNTIVMTNDTAIRSTGGTAGTSRVAIFSGSSITTSGGTLTLTNGAAAVTNNTLDVRFVGSGFDFTRPIVLDGGVGEGNSAQLFVGNSNGTPAQTFSGVISGSGRVRRSATVTSDAGTTIFTAANTYSGGTIVFAGTLLANNTTGSATGSGSVTVTNLGVLGGTGTIAGAVLVQTNGSIAPGASAGTLTLQNGCDASAGGTYIWELTANSTAGPGSNFDVLSVTGGNVVLGGSSKLALSFTGAATAPDAGNAFWQSPRSWTILTVSGGASNPGLTRFANITNSYAAGTFTNYADVSGNIILAFSPNLAPPPPVISGNITGAGTASTTITFSNAQNGVTYTVLYKTNLNQVGWLTNGTVSASGTTASFNDTTGPHSQRYYRIVWP